MKYKAIFDDIDDNEPDEQSELKPWQKNLIIFGLIALVLNLLAVIYVNLCRNVYYWSNADYWTMARAIAKGELGKPLWTAVYESIINSEFNYVPALLPALFARLFGESRMVYILSLVNCYLLPANIMIYLLSKRIGKAPLITALITVFTMPVTTYLTLNGFTEMGGFAISLLCFYLYFRKDNKPPSVTHYILIGILLSVLMLWNGWFVFFGVSFLTAMLACGMLFSKKPYMSFLSLAAVIGVMLVFDGFMFKRLVSDYGSGSFNFEFMLNMKLITRYIGLVFIIMLAVSSVFIVKNKDKRPIFLWLQMIVCYVTFTATRTHGQGHLLMYVPSLLILLILTVKNITAERVLAGVMALAFIHTANIFIPRKQPSGINEIKHMALFPDFSILPKSRLSAYDLLTLKTTLDNVVPKGQYLGVLAYSDVLNTEIMKNIEPSLNLKQNRVDYIANTIPYFDTDNVDISPLCNANYILVAYPAQYVREDQKILTAAVDSFMNWTDIAKAYEEMYDYYTVIDGVEIKLYHRIREASQLEKAQFINKINNN